ncbi:MAG: DUF5916 domain-containing protein [Bacteroidia bacterium]
MNKAAIALFIFLPIVVFSQTEKKNIIALKANSEIIIDGVLDENVWKTSAWASEFQLNYPHDTLPATQQTKTSVVYTSNAVYVAAICYFSAENPRSVRSLNRDFSRDINDAFSVIFDPLLDNTNGFAFTVNLKGAQSEAMIHSGSRLNTIWDNAWIAKTSLKDDHWIVEIKIPFRSIRYDFNSTKWGINFIRVDIAANERSCWNYVPREFDPNALVYAGTLKWEQQIPESKKNISIIPYATGGFQNDITEGNNNVLNAGADVKIGLSSSMNLDLTFNPDFSQAEADAQQINLDRFSLYFPERRNFFIENSDLFSNFGFSRIRPFFSRRIGLSADGELVPIYFGARLSGKLNKNLRVGMLNVQTAEKDTLAPENFTVACFQRQIGGSNIAGILVNKQSFSKNGEENFNRVVGLDYNLLSKDNRWKGKLFYHQSFSDDNNNFQNAHASWISYSGRTYNIVWNHEYVCKDYQADVGFVPREGRGYWRLEPWVQKNFYPKHGILNRHGPRLYYDMYSNEAFEKTDQFLQFSYIFQFNNTAKLNLRTASTYVRLLEPFNPIATDTLKFSVGEYEWQDVSFAFTPASRKKLSFSIYGQYGSFYLGHKYTYGGSFKYRFEPYLQFSLNAGFNYLEMPTPYQSDNLMLISPRMDISFTRKLFFTSLLQYNQQNRLLAVNNRLQYRFKPMSDLFIVFNQRINTQSNYTENSTLVLKLNYWLNA